VREHVNRATVPQHRVASARGGDTDGMVPAGDARDIVERKSPVLFGIRVAGGFGGVVLLAVGLGAVAGRLVSPGRVFLVAAVVTTVVAFIAGILAEPVLRRWAARRRRLGQVECPQPQTGQLSLVSGVQATTPRSGPAARRRSSPKP